MFSAASEGMQVVACIGKCAREAHTASGCDNASWAVGFVIVILVVGLTIGRPSSLD